MIVPIRDKFSPTGFTNILIDKKDMQLIDKYNWRVQTHYPGTESERKNISVTIYKENRAVYLHRLIMGEPPGLVIDHINGNSLDNRRINLRSVNIRQNSYNRSTRLKTKYSGVYEARDKYRVELKRGEIIYRVTGFDSPIDAAKVYNQLAIMLDGDTAFLNKGL